ncbi:MAG: ABC transporter ATP-binding protein [Acidobacteria bacterium]|nr:ABC transporter ATP-binding protein [Acidobacteriota bacterium]
MTVILEADGIVSGYGEVDILHGVSLMVDEGEIVAVIGPNGAGKSTLLKSAFGLLKLRKGKLLLNGVDATNLPPQKMVRNGVSYVPQTDNVFPSLTIVENLEMGAFVSKGNYKQRLSEVYELFPALAERPNVKAGKLSGGQRQMLALARALMLQPRLLLLDEPTASLSPRMVGDILTKIRDINRKGVAILIVEQNAREALNLCHRGYVLVMGKNAMEDTGQNLLHSEEVGRLYLGG